MANLNRIILVGRLVAEPEMRYTVDGTALTKFRLAVNRPKGKSGTAATDFIDIITWRRLAEVCGEYLKKGQLTLVEGKIQNRSYEGKDGQKRYVTEVVARNMQMLERGKGPSSPPPEVIGTEEEPPEAEADPEGDDDLPF